MTKHLIESDFNVPNSIHHHDQTYWSLYDLENDCQINNLSESQARCIFAGMETPVLRKWMIWNPKYLNWFPAESFVDDLSASEVTLKVESQEVPRFPENDRRQYERWSLQTIAELSGNGVTVWTTTVDISFGGIKFQDRIPGRIDDVFKVRLFDGKATVDLYCEPIRSFEGKNTNRARIVARHFETQIRDLIAKSEEKTKAKEEKTFATAVTVVNDKPDQGK